MNTVNLQMRVCLRVVFGCISEYLSVNETVNVCMYVCAVLLSVLVVFLSSDCDFFSFSVHVHYCLVYV